MQCNLDLPPLLLGPAVLGHIERTSALLELPFSALAAHFRLAALLHHRSRPAAATVLPALRSGDESDLQAAVKGLPAAALADLLGSHACASLGSHACVSLSAGL